MSYATANDYMIPQKSVSAEYLKRAGKHLNESTDTKENMLPDRRRANEEEALRVYAELPRFMITKKIVKPVRFVRVISRIFLQSYRIIMLLGLEKMHYI